ncbi:MAG: hypothetical protein B7X04_03220 [Parcubacteria group bacterium 21-54-25]|nr:MAG: hypothetical protein B7X04_03220 [Parcubacteria group bacterium 21-54-25]HQU08000.1 SHOCT domain-containing protein [Candidatus Paceibacterota bacterium]
MIGYWNGYGPGGAGMGLGPLGALLMLVFWIVLIVAVIMFIRHMLGKPDHMRGWNKSSALEALEILRARYANGEIDTKEYEERKKVLTSE